MNFRSRVNESHALPLILLSICLLGLAIAAAVVYANRNALRQRIGAVAPAVPATAAPITWPCPLPSADGAESVATLKKRGALFDVTCRDIRPLIASAIQKGTP